MKKSDRELGMDREINRRDFLSGTSIAIAGTVIAPGDVGAQRSNATITPAASSVADKTTGEDEYYPPTRTGMRGDHPGSFEAAHGIRDGVGWDEPQETGEEYDMIVVGGGLSGLGAAYYFRKAMPQARILILDNHDDFGGHAKRNEVVVDGELVLSYGGTEFLEGAFPYEGLELLHDIGVDAEVYGRANVRGYRGKEQGLGRAVFFDEETFGVNRLVTDEPESDEPEEWAEWLQKTPLSDRVREDIVDLFQTEKDYLPGLSVEEKISQLRKMSYKDYLLNVVGVDSGVIPFFMRRSSWDHNGAASIDSLSAWGAFRYGNFPGMQGLGLGDRPPRHGISGLENPFDGLHFPDGNAGVARLLVRWLIPGSLPGNTMNDSVRTRVRYSTLDRAENDVRIRLNSTVVNVGHLGERARAKGVAVTYVRDGQTYSVRGGTCVMACNNTIIPYLCPDLPADQKKNLHMAVRRPFVIANVVIRHWKAFERLGVARIHYPGAYFEYLHIDGYSSRFGDYETSRVPDKPVAVRLWGSPIAPGLSARDQSRAGRAEMLGISFESFERTIREQMADGLGQGGFDPARDISAIFVNRWPHGYAGGANDLYDPDWGYDEVPWVLGRKRFGRIAIANSDAAATSMTQAAFDQAHRAVQELITDVIRPEFMFPWAERT